MNETGFSLFVLQVLLQKVLYVKFNYKGKEKKQKINDINFIILIGLLLGRYFQLS